MPVHPFGPLAGGALRPLATVFTRFLVLFAVLASLAAHCQKLPCDPSTCDDGNVCNGSETCNSFGRCATGPPPPVDDDDRCTIDTCDPVGGVAHAPIPTCDPTPIEMDEKPYETRASIRGRVVTASGAPATGFTIQVFDVPAATPRPDAEVVLGSEGAFHVRLLQFPQVPPEDAALTHLILRVDSAGTLPATRNVYLLPGQVAQVGTITVVERDPNITNIGRLGGTARDSQNRIEVVIPAGALTTTQPIRITPILERAHMPHPLPDNTPTTYGYELEPDGLTFTTPVTVRIDNWRQLPTTVPIPVAYLDRSTGRWIDEGTATWVNGRFAVEINHFSPADANYSSVGRWVVRVSDGPTPERSAAPVAAVAALAVAIPRWEAQWAWRTARCAS